MATPEQITVAADALSNDAKVWDEVSSQLTVMSGATESMHSSNVEFCWKGDELFGQYSAIVNAVTTYVSAGATAAAGGAETLRSVRDMFIAQEQETVSTINGMWEIEL